MKVEDGATSQAAGGKHRVVVGVGQSMGGEAAGQPRGCGSRVVGGAAAGKLELEGFERSED